MCASRRIPNITFALQPDRFNQGLLVFAFDFVFVCLCLCVSATTCSTRQADDGMVGPQRSEPFVDVGAGEHSPDDR